MGETMKYLVLILSFYSVSSFATPVTNQLLQDCQGAYNHEFIQRATKIILAGGQSKQKFETLARHWKTANNFARQSVQNKPNDLFNEAMILEADYIQHALNADLGADVKSSYYSDRVALAKIEDKQAALMRPYDTRIMDNNDPILTQYEEMMRVRNNKFCAAMTEIFADIQTSEQLANLENFMHDPTLRTEETEEYVGANPHGTDSLN